MEKGIKVVPLQSLRKRGVKESLRNRKKGQQKSLKKGSGIFGDSKIKLDICNRFEREVQQKERLKKELQKINLKKDSEIFGTLKIKSDICNRLTSKRV